MEGKRGRRRGRRREGKGRAVVVAAAAPVLVLMIRAPFFAASLPRELCMLSMSVCGATLDHKREISAHCRNRIKKLTNILQIFSLNHQMIYIGFFWIVNFGESLIGSSL